MDLKADLPLLTSELEVVDRHFTREQPQDITRRWEYAMALKAYRIWYKDCGEPVPIIVDIGGAGSPLSHMLEDVSRIPESVAIVDPALPGGISLEQYRETGKQGDAVFCVSVLEHVDDWTKFRDDLAAVVAPGGLLFLTMDIQGDDNLDVDDRHFHWMRKRIFSPSWWRVLQVQFHEAPGAGWLKQFGEADWSYHGDQLYGPNGYSFASLALTKK